MRFKNVDVVFLIDGHTDGRYQIRLFCNQFEGYPLIQNWGVVFNLFFLSMAASQEEYYKKENVAVDREGNGAR